jgi:hypothetical protein
MILRPRTPEYYALENRDFIPISILGSGKSALGILGQRGPLLRVFRVVKAPPFQIHDTETYFKGLQRSIMRSHSLAKDALRMRVPRAIETYIVRNRKQKAIAVATMMEFVNGPSLYHQIDNMSLTPSKLADLATLFRMMWTKRVSHGDAVGTNIMYDTTHRKYMFIDVDNVRQHPSSKLAKKADMPMMHASMPGVAEYIKRAVVFS